MNDGVPRLPSPSTVMSAPSSSTFFARPKSTTRTSSRLSSRMLPGLMSRCTMPMACAAARALAILDAIWTARSQWNLTSRSSMPWRLSPSTHSISMKCHFPAFPMLWTWTMFRCFSAASERASRRSRAIASSDPPVCSCWSTLSALGWRRPTCSALYTAPMPPSPSFSVIRQCPSCAPMSGSVT